MKNLSLIIILSIFFVNIYSQPNKIGLTTSPLVPSIGIYFISKPIIETQFPLSIYSSFEYADYSKNIDVKILKLAVGSSFIIPNFIKFSSGKTQDIDIHLGLSVNADLNSNTDKYKELTLETGFTIRVVNEIYFSLLSDPLNNHFKFGLCFGL